MTHATTQPATTLSTPTAPVEIAIPQGQKWPTLDPDKLNLVGMDRDELGEAMRRVGVADKQVRMRVAQIWNWIYVRGAYSFDQMTNMSKDLRAKMDLVYTVTHPELVAEQISVDGTRKWLLRFPPRGAGRPVEVETVYIPDNKRGTLCVSSQVGCTLNCTFCHTGTQKLVRNLTAEEIIAQLRVAREMLNDFPEREPDSNAIVPKTGRFVTNVVMMGMGEPLFNYDHVKQAMLIMSDGEGLSISKRRVTLSTSGHVPNIERIGAEVGCALAISLHATNDTLRDELVPINKKWPLKDLLEACRTYPGVSNARRITFEYVMLKGVNDSLEDARQLVKMLRGIPAKINLIPFNPWPGTQHECSDWDQIETFADFINRAGYASPVRTPRGRDIFAACGQLKSETERMRKVDRDRLEAELEALERMRLSNLAGDGMDDDMEEEDVA
ncbi:23S rRNA (adenine(2503)-C(2))-methyltransferase RlmN [Cohaesibacter celericrescens]|uniref:Dual-specificity RNA methyltransferase RlmN n=1 Tax=Cohaesibacter celericrescens TaxID=2067669 RepID=A0A2N5XPA2_9HYPH|nr:23S rRNA (adenine(2503)-C(2))-methyltransferase RlmN [Cohaesibacter celericrescens]PLW76356.1 23S rRNA (adenine(2503)-C(2))-methyltransferase RlmN [Cohaesibacter celericrescens]